jgi:cytochrome c556
MKRKLSMKRTLLMVLALAATGTIAFADDDPIAARKALMDANGDGVKVLVPILKGGPFDLAGVQKALNAFILTADKAPALFPEGSDKGKTGALPEIWQNKDDFSARFQKLGADSRAALISITDRTTFMAAMPGVLKNCGGCHEKYRAKQP